MIRVLLAAVWLFLALPGLGCAQDDGIRLRHALTKGDLAVAVLAIDGDTVLLEDGRKVRLLGIQTAEIGPEETFGATQAQTALNQLIKGQTVQMYHDGAAQDRHGRVLAHLFREDGLWVQGELVALGWARVYTFPDNATAAPALLGREQTARDAGNGLWSNPLYRMRRAAVPDEITPDTYQLVEGRVVDVARVRDWTFLNFGDDWRTDFTAVVPKTATKRFDDLTALKGQRVRVRGWIVWRNGPSVTLDHPAQLERLE